MLLQTELLWAAARIKKGTRLRYRTGRPEASTATEKQHINQQKTECGSVCERSTLVLVCLSADFGIKIH